MIKCLIRQIVFLLPILGVAAGTSLAWYDQTHLAIAKAAGYEHWYNAAGADLAKKKAGSIEERNHYFSNDRNAGVTPEIEMGHYSVAVSLPFTIS